MSIVTPLRAVPTGIGNTNDDVSDYLRKVADAIDEGSWGSVRNAVLLIEDDAGQIGWRGMGAPLDTARLVGLLTITAGLAATKPENERR